MKFHKSTNLGIEIEICVEKEKYKSLKTERKNGEKFINIPRVKILQTRICFKF